ncbi:hypothetical protein C1645_878733 [Glomus cerebriforme]|uniref:F-box domain-containing protein n=1 Tax=Glomus cerebriforme TaxID=658196 RepID=A0A397SUD0_9GLOM|nr:hypothetical protein C1645_878733 [Glomus cerebriforme]
MTETKENVTQKISVNLPVDCVYEIIQYVVHDIKTLHSCITVNQIFCHVVIRVLWSNPFKYVQDKSRKSLIFRTYFSCLDDGKKEQITTFLHKSVSYFPKPFINYPSFLQEFGINDIQTSMKSFLRQYYSASRPLPSDNRINSIVRILNPFIEKLLFNDQSNFKYLNVDYQLNIEKNQIDMSSFDNEILGQVLSNIKKFSFGNFQFDRKNIEFLKFIQRNATTLTDIISKYNKDLQHVRLSLSSTYYYCRGGGQKQSKLHREYNKLLEILRSFIFSLNNLKSIETSCFSIEMDFANLFIKHSHSLTYLKLCDIFNCSIVLDIIENCPNLKTIELSTFSSKGFNKLSFLNDKPITSKLNHLKNFSITIPHSFINKLFERIILMSNNSLKTLFYSRYYNNTFNLYSYFNEVTTSIQPFCTNLTHLYIKIIAEYEFSCAISFLKSLQHLIHLKLSCSGSLKQNNFVDLAQSFSSSLQILEMDSIVAIENLKVLLENMQCNLKEININTFINDTILRLIIKYANQRNSLVKLRYVYYSSNINILYQVLQEARNLFIVEDNTESFTKSFVKSIF